MSWTVIEALATLVGVAVAVIGVVVAILTLVRAERRKKEASELRVEGHDWLVEKEMSYEQLLQQLIGLDYSSTEGLGERHEGTVQQWAPVFKKSPETWRLIVYKDAFIVGYWSFFALSEPLMRRLKAGKMFDSEIVASKVREVSEPGVDAVYFVMITRHPSFAEERRATFRLLIQSLLETLIALQAQGVAVREVYANAFTSAGERLCKAVDGKSLGKADQGGDLYRIVVDERLHHALARLERRPRELERKARPLN
jgi:hypothetical protein